MEFVRPLTSLTIEIRKTKYRYMPIYVILITKYLGKLSSRSLGTGKVFSIRRIRRNIIRNSRFSKREHPSIISPIRYVRELHPIRELISTVYDQQKSLVLTEQK